MYKTFMFQAIKWKVVLFVIVGVSVSISVSEYVCVCSAAIVVAVAVEPLAPCTEIVAIWIRFDYIAHQSKISVKLSKCVMLSQCRNIKFRTSLHWNCSMASPTMLCCLSLNCSRFEHVSGTKSEQIKIFRCYQVKRMGARSMNLCTFTEYDMVLIQKQNCWFAIAKYKSLSWYRVWSTSTGFEAREQKQFRREQTSSDSCTFLIG